MTNPNLSRYRETQVTSATPEETVMMLYDGAKRFLSSAITELKQENIEQKSIFIEKTVKIIDYLQSCLDQEKGLVIAENLDNLYTYMVIELTKANFNNDERKMEEILGLLNTIRDGWNGITNKNNAKNSMPSAYNGTSPNSTADAPGETMEEKKVFIKA